MLKFIKIILKEFIESMIFYRKYTGNDLKFSKKTTSKIVLYLNVVQNNKTSWTHDK